MKALASTLYIDRVIFQDIITFLHHVPKHLVLRKVIPDSFCENIMRRRQFHHVPFLPDQKMTVAGSGVKTVSFLLKAFS
ncbi:hypothetical protein SDC9_159197 [bioreactor metagenome]|uniref:Uncharacterized protein n=1 Tax=bioreactor metagenome TaxID=1076179 RepID=A0A645FBZ7_9ZZZZ